MKAENRGHMAYARISPILGALVAFAAGWLAAGL